MVFDKNYTKKYVKRIMLYLGSGKAKLRKTGEKVHIVSYKGESDKRRKTDWVSYIDAHGGEHEMVKGLNPYWDFDDWDNSEAKFQVRAVDAHLSLFAGMIMQKLICDTTEKKNVKWKAEKSVDIAKELCLALGKVDMESFSKQCLGKEKPE